jgi:phospholipase C
MTLDRRSFLKGAAAGVGLASLGSRADAVTNLVLPRLGLDPVKPATPIDTTVVVMMENRSVDHFLGWVPEIVPGFDATQTRTYSGRPTEDWGAAGRHDYAGCGYADPAHGWDSGRAQRTDQDGDGEPDGFLLPEANDDEFAVSYYQRADLPVYDRLLQDFTTFDRYFCSIMASTYPNRYYMHSAQSGGMVNNDFPPEHGAMTGWEWPTIWTLLDAKGITWAYYFSNLPAIGLWGPRHAHNARHISHYYEDALAGRLPQVSFVDPFFTVQGLANDDHPHADIRLGQEFLSGVITTFIRSPQWQQGALFLNYDEWGGFWDHVMPPVVPDPRGADGFGQLGFRTPTVLVSPYARGPRVDHGVYDHTSILRFIETNYGLGRIHDLDPMARDDHDRDIGAAFDFAAFDPEVDVDALTYVAPPEAHVPCELRGHAPPASDLQALADNGWLEAMGYRLGWRFEDSLAW